MSDPNTMVWSDIQKCAQAHNEIRDSMIGLLASLNLTQKQKLLVVMQNWILKQQPLGVTP